MENTYLSKKYKTIGNKTFRDLEIGELFFSKYRALFKRSIDEMKERNHVYKKISKTIAVIHELRRKEPPSHMRDPVSPNIGDEKNLRWNTQVIRLDDIVECVYINNIYIYFVDGEPNVCSDKKDIPKNTPYTWTSGRFALYKLDNTKP